VKKHHDMKIVYSPMHGAGVRLVPASLRKFGFTNIIMVKEQAVIDGNFPTVESPNPEERKTMSMAIDLAARRGPTSSWLPTPTPTVSASRCATRRASTCC